MGWPVQGSLWNLLLEKSKWSSSITKPVVHREHKALPPPPPDKKNPAVNDLTSSWTVDFFSSVPFFPPSVFSSDLREWSLSPRPDPHCWCGLLLRSYCPGTPTQPRPLLETMRWRWTQKAWVNVTLEFAWFIFLFNVFFPFVIFIIFFFNVFFFIIFILLSLLPFVIFICLYFLLQLLSSSSSSSSSNSLLPFCFIFSFFIYFFLLHLHLFLLLFNFFFSLFYLPFM